MSFQVPNIPYSKFPKKMFTLCNFENDKYEELAFACPWWFISETNWWKEKIQMKESENGFLEYFQVAQNRLCSINLGLYVLIPIKKCNTLQVFRNNCYYLNTNIDNIYMLQDENYAESNEVRIENVTSHKNNKVIFCTMTKVCNY